MDDFVAFLIVGLIIILAMLFFVSSFGLDVPEYCEDGRCYVGIEEHVEEDNITTLYLVGSEEVEVYQTYRFNNVNVSHIKQEKDNVVGGRTLFHGVLFGKQDMKITMDAPEHLEEIYMTFRVNDTNRYGALEIKINGETIRKEVYTTGDYVIEMPVLDSYDIEIVPESSGWRFWSPSVYILENIQIHTAAFSNIKATYEFDVEPDVYEGLTKGEIFFNLDDFQGDAYVTLNGKQIFNRSMLRATAVGYFNKDVFEPGKNRITFEAGENSLLAGDIELHAYHIRSRQYAFETEFNISNAAYRDFRGRLSFNVPEIVAYGGIAVSIYYNNELYYKEYDNLEEKTYIYPLTKGDVGEGVNRVRIEAVQDGAFYLSDVKLGELG
jgi:hypothetical protein